MGIVPAHSARITVRVEWDMGHRLPGHAGACSNVHGHRYAAEFSVDGPIKETPGASDEGMVADFSAVKAIVRAEVAKLDHRFLVADADRLDYGSLPGIVRVPFIPTAENIAWALLSACRVAAVAAPGNVRFSAVRLWETPTSWVEAS